MDDDRPRVRRPGRAPAGLRGAVGAVARLRRLSGLAAARRLTLVCQGATAATAAAGFPQDTDDVLPSAVAALPALRGKLGWHALALAAPSRASLATAAALAAAVESVPALRDCGYGSWAGRDMADIGRAEPDGFARWLAEPDAAPHGGEALAAMTGRLRDWLAATTPGHHLVVAPPTAVRALVVAALDLPMASFWRLDAGPLGVSRLSAQGGRWRLATLNAGC